MIGATSMQFPLLMASKGIEAVMDFAKTGKKPTVTPGLDFFNTGVELITDKPVPASEVKLEYRLTPFNQTEAEAAAK